MNNMDSLLETLRLSKLAMSEQTASGTASTMMPERRKECRNMIVEKAQEKSETSLDDYLQDKNSQMNRAEITKVVDYLSKETGIDKAIVLAKITRMIANKDDEEKVYEAEAEYRKACQLALNEMTVGAGSYSPNTQAMDAKDGLSFLSVVTGGHKTANNIAMGKSDGAVATYIKAGKHYSAADLTYGELEDDHLIKTMGTGRVTDNEALYRGMLKAVANANSGEQEYHDSSTLDGLNKLIQVSFMHKDMDQVITTPDEEMPQDAGSGHDYMMQKYLAALDSQSKSKADDSVVYGANNSMDVASSYKDNVAPSFVEK